jgi:hypothetical protein
MNKYLLMAVLVFIFTLRLDSAENRILIGPEFSHLKRTRQGGTCQSGWLYGIRGRYDHIARYKIYCGFESVYVLGTLSGESGSDQRIKSRFSECSLEGRIGYTFQSKDPRLLSITPFLGTGYFIELNRYTSPSPVKLHFDNRFLYGSAGCILQAHFTPQFDGELDVTVRLGWDDRMKVNRDPKYGSLTLHYMQKLQCRVALPLKYRTSICTFPFEAWAVPFFEYRHYGGKMGTPFDFIDTRIQSWGGTLYCGFAF